MSRHDFAKRVDDLLRNELLALGLAYDDIVTTVDANPVSEGAIVRMKGSWEDMEILPQGRATDDAIAAQISRKLRATLYGPDPTVQGYD